MGEILGRSSGGSTHQVEEAFLDEVAIGGDNFTDAFPAHDGYADAIDHAVSPVMTVFVQVECI